MLRLLLIFIGIISSFRLAAQDDLMAMLEKEDAKQTTYTQVQKYAVNGKLYGSIAHQTGYIAMPSSTSSLSNCEINQIKSWITAGSLNN